MHLLKESLLLLQRRLKLTNCEKDISLSNSQAFTRTKDYSPKRQFQNVLYYGIELVSISKTVPVETPTQHSITEFSRLK